MTATEVLEKVDNQPDTGKITVTPILVRAKNSQITDKSHEAYFLFGTSGRDYVVPLNKNGGLVNPFKSSGEREWLENQLGLDLNPFLKYDNYWHQKIVTLGKVARILDLSNPLDYVDYIVLRTCTDEIALNPKDEVKKATYCYKFVKDNEENENKAAKAKLEVEAYSALGDLVKSDQKMIDFLTAYGKRVAQGSKQPFLITSVREIMEKDLNGFVLLYKDKENYELKLLLQQAVNVGVINKQGRKYFQLGGDALAAAGLQPTIENALDYLRSPKNQDIVLTLKARIEANSDK